ncbi:MAG: zinc ribbon domain-containing protein [Gemmatimonadota bacterium]
MDLLDRLHRHLVAGLTSADAPPDPLTIGDLYQRFIPYRTVRSEFGVLELAEYEFALLRLFSGEGGHLELDDPVARDEIRRELESVNPILGIYRDYAETPVRIGSKAADSQEPEPPRPRAAGAQSDDSPPPAPPAADPARSPAARRTPSAPAPSSATCASCERPLPPLPGVRFCPHCGATQSLQPCRRCGDALESGWTFCIRCGTRVGVA